MHTDKIWPGYQAFPRYMLPGPALTVKDPPRIFVYDLPPEFRNCSFAENGEWLIYGAETIFPRALRESQIYVTEDPEEADFFYVDALLYCTQGIHSLWK